MSTAELFEWPASRPEPETVSLALIDRARTALAQAETLADIGLVRDVAERARRYASAAKLGRDAENYATRLRLEAERQAGALLAGMDRQRPADGRPKVSDHPTLSRLRLADLGVSRQQASDWQRMAKVSDEAFTAHVTHAQQTGQPLTTAGVVQLARQIERKATATAPRPVVIPELVPARVEVADALALPLDVPTVHLTVTSPPYALDVEYDDVDVDPEAWPALIEASCAEIRRVTVPHGRLALNVPLDTTKGGFRPTYAQAVAAAQRAGWRYRSTIVWDDNTITKTTARGSDSASAPHVIARCEMIALFSNDEWRRSSSVPSDLRHDEWLDWTDGTWSFPGESSPWEGHPAAFPIRLPHQLIKLLSFPGDTVLDPFCGSGTTLVAALRLGRVAIGFDRSERYVESARRRLAAEP